jgi:hypothetical protein
MPYTTVPTSSVGQILTAAWMNTYVRDNINYLKGQAGSVAIENTMSVGPTSAGGSSSIRIGGNASGNRYAYFDLSGDDTYGDGLRVIRDNTGPNTTSRVVHRGTGNFEFQTIEAAGIFFRTTASYRGGVTSAGDWGFGTISPQGKVHAIDSNGRGIVFVSGVITTSATTVVSGLSISAGAAFIGSIRTASNSWFTTSGGIASGSSNYIWNNGGTPSALTMSVTSSSVSMTSGGSSPVTLTIIGWLYYF